jgi:hypothetical protein
MVEVAEMNYVRPEILQHSDEGCLQWGVYVAILMVRHVHSPDSNGGDDLIRLISLGGIQLPREFLAGKDPDFVTLPDELMAQSLGVDFGAGAVCGWIAMNYLHYLHKKIILLWLMQGKRRLRCLFYYVSPFMRRTLM